LDQQHSIVQWALSACRWFLTGLYHNHRKAIEKVIHRVAGLAAITACTVRLYFRHGRTPLEIISPRPGPAADRLPGSSPAAPLPRLLLARPLPLRALRRFALRRALAPPAALPAFAQTAVRANLEAPPGDLTEKLALL
jgi:hypothetical protein